MKMFVVLWGPLGSFGVLWGSFWVLWAPLGSFGGPLGGSFGVLWGVLWGLLGCPLGSFGVLWGPLGVFSRTGFWCSSIQTWLFLSPNAEYLEKGSRTRSCGGIPYIRSI